jgi:hypothetical protein
MALEQFCSSVLESDIQDSLKRLGSLVSCEDGAEHTVLDDSVVPKCP